jgi:hypothetical protein
MFIWRPPDHGIHLWRHVLVHLFEARARAQVEELCVHGGVHGGVHKGVHGGVHGVKGGVEGSLHLKTLLSGFRLKTLPSIDPTFCKAWGEFHD